MIVAACAHQSPLPTLWAMESRRPCAMAGWSNGCSRRSMVQQVMKKTELLISTQTGISCGRDRRPASIQPTSRNRPSSRKKKLPAGAVKVSRGIIPTPARQRARLPKVGKARRRRPTCAAGAAFASRNGAFAPEALDPGGAASLPKFTRC